MKFGKYLEAEQVPEWEKMYVDYRALKRLTKKIVAALEARRLSSPEERTSLLRRASTYLGYNSMALDDSGTNRANSDTIAAVPTPPPIASSAPTKSSNPPFACSSYQSNFSWQTELDTKGKNNDTVCSDTDCTTCSHFNSIVSATPQVAMSMSATNTGKVAATSMELAHGANVKLPLSAQDSFSETRQRRTPVAADCMSSGEFKKELSTRLDEERDLFDKLEKELVKVNDFYKQKQTLFATRLDNIKSQQRIYDEMLGEELEASALNAEMNRSRVTFRRTFTNGESSKSKPVKFEPSQQLQAAKGKLKRAMLELYRGMDLLKNYRILCYTAFIKALKKYQKTAMWCRGTDYFLNRVDSCYIATSDRLNCMSAELEGMYVSRYADGSRSKGMQKLRVTSSGTGSSHQGSIFRSGIMLGASVPLVARAIYEANLLSNEQRVPYHRQLLQMYGSIYLVLIFLLLFSLNIMAWAQAHINYRFIFEFDPRDYLDSWQFLEISSLYIFITSVVIWVNFALHIDNNSYICIYVLLGVLFGLFLTPVNIFYWSSRRWLIKSLWRLLLSGVYKVGFRDFFLGDELCSLTYTFSMFLMFGCASANHWSDLDEVCDTTQWWSNAAFLMLPNLLRLLQCIRRFADSGDAFPHLANGSKYLSTIITIWLASANRIAGGTAWRSIWVASAIVNSCFTSLWDLLMDWGLFESNTKHRFLRSELKFERVWLYYVAIVVDVILRFFWITQISPNFFSFGYKFHQATIAYIAAVFEVVRRFCWNFFRVENEHISNCGQFRATTDIPLPFRPSDFEHSDSEQAHNEFEHDYSVVPVASPKSPQAVVSPIT